MKVWDGGTRRRLQSDTAQHYVEQSETRYASHALCSLTTQSGRVQILCIKPKTMRQHIQNNNNTYFLLWVARRVFTICWREQERQREREVEKLIVGSRHSRRMVEWTEGSPKWRNDVCEHMWNLNITPFHRSDISLLAGAVMAQWIGCSTHKQ